MHTAYSTFALSCWRKTSTAKVVGVSLCTCNWPTNEPKKVNNTGSHQLVANKLALSPFDNIHSKSLQPSPSGQQSMKFGKCIHNKAGLNSLYSKPVLSVGLKHISEDFTPNTYPVHSSQSVWVCLALTNEYFLFIRSYRAPWAVPYSMCVLFIVFCFSFRPITVIVICLPAICVFWLRNVVFL